QADRTNREKRATKSVPEVFADKRTGHRAQTDRTVQETFSATNPESPDCSSAPTTSLETMKGPLQPLTRKACRPSVLDSSSRSCKTMFTFPSELRVNTERQ